MTPATCAFAKAWAERKHESELWPLFVAAAESVRERIKHCKQGAGGVLLATTLFTLRAEAERLGQTEQAWSLSQFWQKHPRLYQSLFCTVITSNPGIFKGVRMSAFADSGDRIDLAYLIFPEELRVHVDVYGIYRPFLTRFREVFSQVCGELRDFVHLYGSAQEARPREFILPARSNDSGSFL